MRLVGRPEAPRAVSLRVGDRRPAPPVALYESIAFVGRVRDIETEKCELRVTLLELRVGDRLALAGASPRRPDVDEHLLSTEVGQGGPLPVERDSLDRRRRRAFRRIVRSCGLCHRRRCGRRSDFVVGAATAARHEQRAESRKEGQRAHEFTVAPGVALEFDVFNLP